MSYVAFVNGMTSGIKSKDAATKWATELLQGGKHQQVHLAKVEEVIQRSAPPIVIIAYEAPPTTIISEAAE